MEKEIHLEDVELQDGQLLVVYIMLRTFSDIDLYKIVLFYMCLEAYIFENKEDNIIFDFQKAAEYLDMEIDDFKEGLGKLIDWGWIKENEGYCSVDYKMIYKLNQEIVSEEKEDITDIDVRDRIDENRRNGVKMLLERYWENGL